MTTGNDVQDFRTTVVTQCGTGLAGTYWRRQWNGGNNPSIGVKQPPPRPNPQLGVYSSRKPLTRTRTNGEHPYSMTLLAYRDSPGEWTSNGGSTWFTGTIGMCTGGVGFNWNLAITANDELTLIGKLREAVIGSDFNPAVTLGEGKKSLETIANAANALAGTLYHAKRGNVSAALKSLASYKRTNGSKPEKAALNLAQNNLQIQYGIKPILNDVYNAATTLAHLTSAPMQDVITVSIKKPGIVYSASPSLISFSGWCWKAKKIKYIRREVNIVKLIGLTDPAQVAWELLPYSFVVDWFIPIGDFLQARGVANSLTGTFVTSTISKGYASTPTYKPAGMAMRGGMSSYYRREVILTRTVSTNLSVPMPTIKPLNDWASWRHARDAVSLLIAGRKSGG